MFHTSEADLIDALLFLAWHDEVRAGQRASAREGALAWIERAVANGLPVEGTTRGARRFDAPLTLNFLRARGLDGRDPLWRDRVLATKRRHLADYAAASPPEGTTHQPQRITLVFERSIVRSDLPPGRATKLALPLPQEEATQRDIVVEPIEEPGARLVREPGALVRVGVVPDDQVVRVGARISFTATWRTHALDGVAIDAIDEDDPALRPYLAAREALVHITPAIAQLAASLRRDDPLATLRAFWEHAFDRLTFGAVRYDELGTDDPLSVALRGRWADCYVVSSLLAALCRAVGLPARVVSGMLLTSCDLGPHNWLEVWLPPHGWVPLDIHASVLAAGDQRDLPWATSMFGRLPHQLVLDRLPLTRPLLGLWLPPRWFSLQRFDGDHAVHTGFYDRATGALRSADRVERVI